MTSCSGPSGGFYEFFAGGGMARAGLGPNWNCLLANDIDAKKAATYALNWGDQELEVCDVALLSPAELPPGADLAWASFPCQDLSLAGLGAGLRGRRSGTFWPFWKLVQGLKREGRPLGMIVLENVCGALTSHGGEDFRAIIGSLLAEGYRYGALVIDAVHFVPQSRPRLFIVAVRADVDIPTGLLRSAPEIIWTSPGLLKAFESLPGAQKSNWVWWGLSTPAARQNNFSDLIEDEPVGVHWHTDAETSRLVDLMSLVHRKKLMEARKAGRQIVGAVYKRTRTDADGMRAQRAEVRFDDIAGCLRTPVGGSSRQFIVVVDGERVRSRLLSAREAGRLMGLPEDYRMPRSYNEAYHVAGDGLVVPVVRHLSASILEPLLNAIQASGRQAA